MRLELGLLLFSSLSIKSSQQVLTQPESNKMRSINVNVLDFLLQILKKPALWLKIGGKMFSEASNPTNSRIDTISC